jgi:hypothetical protein
MTNEPLRCARVRERVSRACGFRQCLLPLFLTARVTCGAEGSAVPSGLGVFWALFPKVGNLGQSCMLNQNCCPLRRKPLKAHWTGFATRWAAVRPRLPRPLLGPPDAEKVSPMSVHKMLPMSVRRAVRGKGVLAKQGYLYEQSGAARPRYHPPVSFLRHWSPAARLSLPIPMRNPKISCYLRSWLRW